MVRQRLRIFALGVVAVMAVVVTAGCSSGTATNSTGSGTGGGTGSGTGATVVEQNYAFNPTSLSVKVGDTVTFSNQDSVAHHVVVGGSDLGIQQPGADVTWTADKNGAMPFKCVIHPSMTGQVLVGTTSTPATGTGAGATTPSSGGGY